MNCEPFGRAVVDMPRYRAYPFWRDAVTGIINETKALAKIMGNIPDERRRRILAREVWAMEQDAARYMEAVRR